MSSALHVSKHQTGKYISCKTCGKKVYKILCKLKQKNRRFCSPQCANTFHAELHALTKKLTVPCGFCKKPLTIRKHRLDISKTKKVYCSHKCFGAAVSKCIIVKCNYCGILKKVSAYKVKHSKSGLWWCSNRCKHVDPIFFKIRKKIHKRCEITKPEQTVDTIIQKYKLPYKYTGNGDFWLHSINPDFVNTNGEKKAIEVDGCYWHNCPLCHLCHPGQKGYSRNRRRDMHKDKVYEHYGWTVIHLWEHELGKTRDEQAIVRRLL